MLNLQEVQWTDIDYMSGLKDWTYDKIMFRGLPKIVKNLHDEGQKYIPIVVSIYLYMLYIFIHFLQSCY